MSAKNEQGALYGLLVLAGLGAATAAHSTLEAYRIRDEGFAEPSACTVAFPTLPRVGSAALLLSEDRVW